MLGLDPSISGELGFEASSGVRFSGPRRARPENDV